MSIQIPLFDGTTSKPSKTARVEEGVSDGFNLKKFLENFEVLAEAAGGVDHLRDLVIELALHGALVPQQPEDIPASNLLDRAREALGEQPERRAVDGLAATPYTLPVGWAWCEPQDLGVVAPRNDVRDEADVAFVPMNVVPIDYRGVLTPERRRWRDIKKGYTHVADGDVAVAKITPCFQNKKSCVMRNLAGGVGAGTTELLVLRPVPGVVVADYLLLYFKSPDFISGGIPRMTGTAGQKRVPADYFAAAPLPLPSLDEQRRIVAKVDELMRLIDDLEAKQTNKRVVQTRLRTSALDALTSAKGPEDFATAWKRVEENFGVLFQGPKSIAEIRGTILCVAAQGRLVTPSKTARPNVPSGQSYDPDFTIPDHWGWSPLGRLCKFIDYRGRTPTKTAQGVKLVTAKNVRMGVLRDEPREFIAESNYDAWMTRGLPQFGDVLFTTEAPLGNVAQLLTHEKIALAQRIITMRPVPGVGTAFLKTVLMSPLLQASIRQRATGTTAQGIKAAKLKLIPFPIPPEEEQERIVAKVEQLMKLCDDLEANLERRESIATKLAEAVASEVVT